ncbi:unnamed protein product [Coffea canephora]|uniref:Uncharacterized protein n=1 Tax=Coffea canephora TaxID=49390 RepID=A0A068TLN3_COFCA|nr:unnamed protein product [Coffea canephora]
MLHGLLFTVKGAGRGRTSKVHSCEINNSFGAKSRCYPSRSCHGIWSRSNGYLLEVFSSNLHLAGGLLTCLICNYDRQAQASGTIFASVCAH